MSIVPIGSIPEMPAETCKEIKASEGGQAISGKYWFDSIIPEKTVLAPCNMETEGELFKTTTVVPFQFRCFNDLRKRN